MKKLFALLTALCCLCTIVAQKPHTFKPKITKWVKAAAKYDDRFFTTDEARRIGDNLLLYQHTTGGWPKNVNMQTPLTDSDKKQLLKEKDAVNESTIDNGATTTEMVYLARLYNATHENKYKDAVLRGIDYLLDAQYDNGGWPQFYPRPKGYYTQITYNDDAMLNVMKVLRKIYEQQAPFTFIPETTCTSVKAAFDKGIDCILKTQVRINGKLTVWCAQHDKETLLPCKARAYELPSLSGSESFNLILFLMSLPDPSDPMKQAIESAVAWTKATQIKNLKREYFTNDEGKGDYRMVTVKHAPAIWARFYDLENGEPYFTDRTGIKRNNISEISYERRNGYSWYTTGGREVLKAYESWKKRNN